MAVSAGKAVFCEKPLALSSAETRQCLAAAEKNKVPIYCGFQRRWDPNFLRLKTALEGPSAFLSSRNSISFYDQPTQKTKWR